MSSAGSISSNYEGEDVVADLGTNEQKTYGTDKQNDPVIAASFGKPRPRMHRLSTVETQRFDTMAYNTNMGRCTVISTPYHQKKLKRLSTRQTQAINHTYNTRVSGFNFQNMYEKCASVLQLSNIACEAIFSMNNFIMVCVYCAITASVIYGQTNGVVVTYLGESAKTVGFFSSIMGFGLVFRLNICYNRWWEGRCLWGKLIYASINLAQQGQCWINEKESLRRLCCAVIGFPFACKCQLRGESIKEDSEALLLKGLINETQVETVIKRRGWEPYYFLGAMREAINNGLEQSRVANKENYTYRGSTTESQILIFENSLDALAESIGGLLRVKSTGLPIAYDQVFGIIFDIFFLIATLAWSPSIGWYAPLLVAVLKFVVTLLMLMGTKLEDPFGDDVTDLPLEKYCEAIETQVEAVFNDAFSIDLIGGGWACDEECPLF